MNKLFNLVFAAILCFNFSSHAQNFENNSLSTNPKKQNSIHFIENKGQVVNQHFEARKDVLFSGTVENMDFHLHKNGISYQMTRVDSWSKNENNIITNALQGNMVPEEITIYRTDIKWIGHNKHFTVSKGHKYDDYNNYYLPGSEDGIHFVPSYNAITFKEIYNGIDLKYYNKNGALEYDYIVAPNIDYRKIQWSINGANDVHIDEQGALVYNTPFGIIKEQAPIAYQNNNRINAKWIISNDIIGFEIEEYNPNLTLTIDPIIRSWATYYGGTSSETGYGIISDASANLYVTGYTSSTTNIATTGAQQTTLNGSTNAFITKFNASGTRQWGTYMGGTQTENPFEIVIDPTGDLVLTGSTSSSGIATIGSYQSTYGGSTDAFIAKFRSNGLRVWLTYFGGTAHDNGYGCVVDDSSNIYISGSTNSTTVIASPGSFQPTHGGLSDIFLAKFDKNGNRIWGTYLGGTSNETANRLNIDGLNNLYLCGRSSSTSGVASPGCHQSTYGGGTYDGILARFDENGNQKWATYYGGLGQDYIVGCVVDASYNIYMTGSVRSTSGISTAGSFQTTYGGVEDAMLVKFDSSGSRIWGTYFGGSSNEAGFNCKLDNAGNVYLIGSTASTNAIATPGEYQSANAGSWDMFLAKFNNSGAQQWATYYGGTGLDFATNLNVNNNVFHFTGYSNSTSNVTSSGAHQTSFGGGTDALIVKMAECITTTGTISPNSCDSYTSPSAKFTFTSTGIYKDTISNSLGCDSIITINLTITPTPSISSSNGADRCGPGVVTLSGSVSSGQLYWYANAVGGNPLDSGNTFTTPSISSNTTYYVGAGDNGCFSASRIAVVATIKTIPSVTTSTPGNVCDSGSVTLLANASNGVINWFAASSGGTIIGTGTTFNTPGITTSTSYYAEASDNGCNSARTAVLATVYTTPDVLTTKNDSVCDEGIMSLGATVSAGGLNWYGSSTGGPTLGTGSPFTTPNLTSTTFYFAEAHSNGCQSDRSAVMAIVHNSTNSTITEKSCYEYTVPSGNLTYYATGTYKDTLLNAIGCDSIITINLTINKTDTAVNTDGRNLTANATTATYQWINCDNNQLITGATNNIFTAAANGNYAVIVNQDGCIDTSSCYSITTVGTESNPSLKFNVYPNPANEVINFELGKKYTSVEIKLLNDIGQVLIHKDERAIHRSTIKIDHLSNGIYYLHITTEEGNKVIPIIKS